MKWIRLILIITYVCIIFSITIFGRPVLAESVFKGLFWEMQNGYWRDICLNIVLFVPLGFLIGGWKGLFIGFFLKCGIETIQFYLKLGFCELDDIVNNTIGATLGVLIHTIIRKKTR